jgi:hypothetical protein
MIVVKKFGGRASLNASNCNCHYCMCICTCFIPPDYTGNYQLNYLHAAMTAPVSAGTMWNIHQ